MLKTRNRHTVPQGWSGLVEYEYVVKEVSSLEGPYLDYALGCTVLDEGLMVMDFIPASAWRVCFGPRESELNPWSPSNDQTLAEKIITTWRNHLESETLTDKLREIVRSKYGDNIEVPRIKCRLT